MMSEVRRENAKSLLDDLEEDYNRKEVTNLLQAAQQINAERRALE